jgi:hypothetical protein
MPAGGRSMAAHIAQFGCPAAGVAVRPAGRRRQWPRGASAGASGPALAGTRLDLSAMHVNSAVDRHRAACGWIPRQEECGVMLAPASATSTSAQHDHPAPPGYAVQWFGLALAVSW